MALKVNLLSSLLASRTQPEPVGLGSSAQAPVGLVFVQRIAELEMRSDELKQPGCPEARKTASSAFRASPRCEDFAICSF